MSTVGYSTLDVIPSVKNLRSQLESQTSRDFAAAGKRGGALFGDAAGKEAGGRFKTKFGSLAKDAFAPIAGIVAGAAVVGLFKDAIQGASDLAESGTKVKQIFGDATDEVTKFAGQGAKALGQSKLAVLDAASSLGTFGKAAGLSGSELASFSTQLVSLSTDMASFFNTNPADAAEAISAGLRGEAEPLRRFGVLLDDTTLRQEALSQGLIQTTKQALTPQQKVLAAYQVILKQTTDAQGDFARTAGGLANQSRTLTAEWADMKAELGSKLLPAATATVHAFNDDVLPAMENAGGAVAGAAKAFGGLPAPVKAAVGALVALRVAEATGVTAKLASGADSAKTAFAAATQRVDFFRAAYSNARGEIFSFGRDAGVASGQVSKLSATLSGLRAASFGAGQGLKRGLSGAVNVVGGPWGAAFIAGTAVIAHFWAEHQKAKQRVEDFTATLDKETGALTQNSREFAAKELADSGVLAAAQRLGVSLETVTNAALGQKDAYASLTAQIASRGQLDDKAAADAIKVKSAIDDQNGVVQKSIVNQKLFAAALGGTTDAQGQATGAVGDSVSAQGQANQAVQTYATRLEAVKSALRGVLTEETKRRNANLQDRQDALALVEQLTAARKEAREGAKTLDINTKAGQENQHALLDLASQWNNSADAVKNAKGAYVDMRQNFIDVATSMGATRAEAEKLAKKILDVPKKAPIEFQSKGFKERMAELRALKREAEALIRGKLVLNLQGTTNKRAALDAKASGGMIGGRGTGTSDSNLIWASRGEFMQPKDSVDYYGTAFMEAIRRRQLPRFAEGGPIGPTTTTSPLGHHISGTLGIDRDGIAYIYGVARAEADAEAQYRARTTRTNRLAGMR